MPSPTGGQDGDISDEARMLAASARARAAQLPGAARIAEMALTPGGGMSPDEIRKLATSAVSQAAQVSYLLGRLAALLDDEPAGGAGGTV